MPVKHYLIRMRQFEVVKDQSAYTGLTNSVFVICARQFQLLICIKRVNGYQVPVGNSIR